MVIHSKIKKYTVELIEDISTVTQAMDDKNMKYYFLIDEKVYSIYQKQLAALMEGCEKILILACEESKALPYIMRIYRKLFEMGFKRNDTLFTIGGGILQDMSGFIASTLYRGVRWIFMPTTLLAQADSCIGSKTSVNFDQWKNQLGTFYPPDRVYINPNFIETLSERDFRSGLGEMIKVHLMGDESSFQSLSEYLSQNCLREKAYLVKMIFQSLSIKQSYFQEDEFDSGRRNLLNYGHCFGHALESASNFAIAHGEAVLWGISFANFIALNRKILNQNEFQRIQQLLCPYFTKFNFKSIPVAQIIEGMKRDKKRLNDQLAMILLKDMGHLQKQDDIQFREVEEGYRRLGERI